MAALYRVVAGDSLPALAYSFYGDNAMALALAAANGITTASGLAEGHELVVPYITHRHIVAPGDTLFDLAELYYGNGAMFPVISAANHITEPHLIEAGEHLLVPDLINVSLHTVRPGDSLREFALRWYNDELCAPVIEHANYLAGQDAIEIGQVLVRPGLNRRHIVEPDETWTQLSQCWYGDPTLDRLIAAANHMSVDSPPPPGHTLFLPDLAEF